MAPACRAVLIASATRLAAPRAEPALPPRNRAAATTGAASGVLTVAASTFNPRTSSDFEAILACPNAAPCLVPPYTRRCTESTSMNASVSAPGSNGVRAASSASTRRCTAASWRTLPWSNARRKLPSVDGARIPPTVAGNAPWRSRSIPSMVSAPATIPATSEPIFNPGFAPTLAATRTCRPARSSSPMFWASRTAGTSPACDTRFGSSNLACVLAAVCNNRIPEVPFRSWRCELQQPAFSQVKGHFCCHDTLPRTIRTVDPG